MLSRKAFLVEQLQNFVTNQFVAHERATLLIKISVFSKENDLKWHSGATKGNSFRNLGDNFIHILSNLYFQML